MHPLERSALMLLRGGAVQRSEHVRAAFNQLSDRLRAIGGIIHEVDAPFASADEISILALLAALQRPSMHMPDRLSVAFRPALTECAKGLTELGIRLPHGAILRRPAWELRSPMEDTIVAQIAIQPATERSILPGDHWSERSQSPRARALALAKARSFVRTSDFQAIGVSRQLVSNLRRDGLLVRARHGVYRVNSGEVG
jgi:hypothetical protein